MPIWEKCSSTYFNRKIAKPKKVSRNVSPTRFLISHQASPTAAAEIDVRDPVRKTAPNIAQKKSACDNLLLNEDRPSTAKTA